MWALVEAGRNGEIEDALAEVPDSDDELVLLVRTLARHALGDKGEVERLTARQRGLAASNEVTGSPGRCS